MAGCKDKEKVRSDCFLLKTFMFYQKFFSCFSVHAVASKIQNGFNILFSIYNNINRKQGQEQIVE
jgi:hypothetical protein